MILFDRDCTYHFYHDGQRCVEVRNGSDQVLKQQVWGGQYVDVQVALKADPSAGRKDAFARLRRIG